MDEQALEELTRFHEAMDESLTLAIGWYHAKLEDARDLLNGVLAHDLRSPLGAILNSADVLLLDDSLSPQQASAAARMRQSAFRMRSMITDLLDFTRTRLGSGLPLAIGEYDIGLIIREVCEEQRALHPSATMHCETSGDLTGQRDYERIGRMLANLIGNAIAHGEQSPVSVIAEGQANGVTLRVHNARGVIDEHEKRLLFDPMRRAAAKRGENRSLQAQIGLGLYIARTITEAHGGVIEVSSSQDDGTKLTVRLPRERAKGAEKAGLT